jgi:hypothetical protein
VIFHSTQTISYISWKPSAVITHSHFPYTSVAWREATKIMQGTWRGFGCWDFSEKKRMDIWVPFSWAQRTFKVKDGGPTGTLARNRAPLSWYQIVGQKGPVIRSRCIGTVRTRTQILIRSSLWRRKQSKTVNAEDGTTDDKLLCACMSISTFFSIGSRLWHHAQTKFYRYHDCVYSHHCKKDMTRKWTVLYRVPFRTWPTSTGRTV